MIQDQINYKNFIAVLVCSTLLAAVLTLIRLPDWLFYFRPDWLALVVIYWVMVVPDRLSLAYGCLNGLFLDLLLVKPFGLNAIAFVMLSYVVAIWSSQIRVLSLWHQCLFVIVLIAVLKLIVGIIATFTTGFVFTGYYWLSAIGNLIFWPVITIGFSDFRSLFFSNTIKR